VLSQMEGEVLKSWRLTGGYAWIVQQGFPPRARYRLQAPRTIDGRHGAEKSDHWYAHLPQRNKKLQESER
jgi:hypothetical protein